jgi:hypothetical protein
MDGEWRSEKLHIAYSSRRSVPAGECYFMKRQSAVLSNTILEQSAQVADGLAYMHQAEVASLSLVNREP